MNLRVRSLIVYVLSLALIISIIYLVSNIIILGSYENLEKQGCIKNVQVALDTIENDVMGLDSTVSDWSYWDETYNFIKGKNNAYINNNLQNSTFYNLKVNFILYSDTSGKIIYKKAYDNNNSKSISFPKSLVSITRNIKIDAVKNKQILEKRGLIFTKEGPIVIASRLVRRNDGNGRPVGILTMGHFMLRDDINRLFKTAKLNVEIDNFSNNISKNEISNVTSLINNKSKVFIKTDEADSLYGYTLLSDYFNYKDILLKVTMPRDIYVRGKSNINNFIITILLIAFIFCTFTIYYLDKLVLRRILSLNKEVSIIGKDKDFSKRVAVSGNDEISNLSKSTNLMIAALEKSIQTIEQKTEEQAILLENTDIQIWYLTDVYTYGSVNNAHARFFNKEKEDIENKKIADLIRNREMVEKYIDGNRHVFENKIQSKTEMLIKKSNGEEYILYVIRTPKINFENNSIEYVVCSAEDITERKKNEDKVKYLGVHDELSGLYNRAYLEEEMKKLKELKLLLISIIIGDINGLKKINDNYGRKTGDLIIKRVSKVLAEYFNRVELISRWGGDEFAVILPEADESEALCACEDLNKLFLSETPPISVTFGISTMDDYFQDLPNILKQAEDRMYRHKLLNENSSRSSVLSSLEKTQSERSNETEEHARRMISLSVKLGKAIGLSHDNLDKLELIAALHDIGKIGIPDKILLKNGKLTKDEFDTMKKHSEIGYRIALLSPELSSIANGILSHHERWDGSGYPNALKGDEIPILSRIISIIDAYDVITHKRIYKEAVSEELAKLEIERCSGTQFDPVLVEKFLEL